MVTKEKLLYNQHSKAQIAEAVKRVGAEITNDYAGKNPLIIGILKGSFIFMADLVREIDLSCQVDFMVVKSYGGGTVSSGYVRIVKDIDTVIEDRDVIIVEDILDTANTLQNVCDVLLSRKPRSLKVCVFLNKRKNRKIQFDADYECFEIEDEFVVGYGLDYAEKYRNLPYLAVLKEAFEHGSSEEQ
ncbi:MAG: hypoxanthine phosphoribosyltransferase [Oscillospiraceae bacterium]|nr:hypoxanthine phosphoribosyltransferase [Oscillospiraceae bacterium]